MQTHRRRLFVLNLLVTGVIGLAYPTALLAQATLENPRPGSFQSGIGVISGWVCEAERIEIVFDDEATKWQAAYGTSRSDTAGEAVCNDDGNNGFGLLFNWNLLGAGRHTVRALADGEEFARATVTVTTFDDEKFLQDVGRHERLEDFPEVGTDSIVAWQTSLQNFVIARVDPLASQIRSMDAAGDSISKGFNADDADMCTNADQEELNWATSVTHSTDFNAAGAEGVFSQAERLEERQGASIQTVSPNSAASGAQMLKDFVAQAESIKTSLSSRPAPRYTTVVLGHNDICAGTLDKSQDSCEIGSDQDSTNHCRTTPEAFEREFRKGLDILITVPELKIGVASLVRLTQLCNHPGKVACGLGEGLMCGAVWQIAPALRENGICGSLTLDCSDERIQDAYEMARQYRDILDRVTHEYAAIPAGSASPGVTVAGETVGGASKAVGTRLTFSNASWEYKFASEDLSCCDCFHPSAQGQTVAARILFDGFTCNETDVCCRDTGDALVDGQCSSEDTSGRFVPGLF